MKFFYSTNMFALLVICFAMFFASCKKDDLNNGNNTYPPDLITKVNATSVSGFVTNENNQPVLNAQVQIGSSTITTDKYGFFEAKNIDVIKTAATVTVTKAGYFKGIKTFIAEQDKSAFFRIKLIPKTTTGSVNGGAGGAVILTNGMSVTFPANSIVNATTNATYTGTVNVAAYWINPTSNDLPLEMPGDLRGVNTDGNLQLLTTYGMAAVELTGSGGELLQIATGKKASLSLPIPVSILATAPATIPLWSFDEVKGLWKQEGTATKTGSNYVGEVSHFSFWNVDVPGNFVQLSAIVANANNQPIQNALVKISVVGNPANFRYGLTDANGYVSGAVPSNSQLLVEILSNLSCLSVIHSQNVTTTTLNISMGTIVITNPSILANINGNVLNCSNMPVTNGYILVHNGWGYSRYDLSNTGSYFINLIVCNNVSNSITLIAIDNIALEESATQTFSIVAGNNSIPAIQACGIPLEFVYLVVNGAPQQYIMPRDKINMYQTNVNDILIGYMPIPYVMHGNIQFTKSGIGVGNNQVLTQFSIPQIIANLTSTNPPTLVHITEYGAVGQFVSGNFSDSFVRSGQTTQYNISCSFRAKRIY